MSQHVNMGDRPAKKKDSAVVVFAIGFMCIVAGVMLHFGVSPAAVLIFVGIGFILGSI